MDFQATDFCYFISTFIIGSPFVRFQASIELIYPLSCVSSVLAFSFEHGCLSLELERCRTFCRHSLFYLTEPFYISVDKSERDGTD